MNKVQAATVANGLLDIDEISARTGHSASTIYVLRSKGHELYSRARRHGKKLVLEEPVVSDWVQRHKREVTRRLQPKVRTQQPDKSETFAEISERIATDEDWAKISPGFDVMRHHSWCIKPRCPGCLDEQW